MSEYKPHFTEEEAKAFASCKEDCGECSVYDKCNFIKIAQENMHHRKEIARLTAERNDTIKANKVLTKFITGFANDMRKFYNVNIPNLEKMLKALEVKADAAKDTE